MYHCRPNWIFAVLLVSSCFRAFGQTTNAGSNPLNGRENNPYSRYGIGELRNGNNVALRGMGNITSAWANQYLLNTDNPASYSFLRRTTFEVGASGTTRTTHGTLNGSDISYRTGSVSVAYMNLGVPVGKNGGLCLGFRPYSTAYSRLEDTISFYTPIVSPIGRTVRSYLSRGGMNYAFIGGAAKYKGLSLGVNAGYVFGNFSRSDVLIPRDSFAVNDAFYTQFVTNNRVGGILWKAGLQYEIKIDSLHMLRLGGTLSLGQDMKEVFSEQRLSAYAFQDTVIRDTAYDSGERSGTLTLPLTYSAGFVFTRPGKWSVGADYTATQWSQFKSELSPTMMTGIAASSYRMSLGGEYTPGAETSRRYLSRATYRLGGYFGNDYLQLQNTQLSYFAITGGLSLPFRRSLSQLHAAVDIGRLGTTDNGLLRQNFVKLSLGISLSDLWFIRRYEQ